MRWIGRLVVALTLCTGVAAPLNPIRTAHVHAEQDPATIIVYVTHTGEKYHRDGCRYLSKSKIAISLKDAAARYAPCSVCKPPILR